MLHCQSAQYIQLLYEFGSKTGILVPRPGSKIPFLVRHSEQGGLQPLSLGVSLVQKGTVYFTFYQLGTDPNCTIIPRKKAVNPYKVTGKIAEKCRIITKKLRDYGWTGRTGCCQLR